MRKHTLGLLAAAAVVAAILPARAADIPPIFKAPSAGYPYAADGFYFGLGASSTAASATVSNTGIFAAGAGLDLVVGYQFRGGLQFIAPELNVTYTNIGNSAACPVVGGVVSCAANDQWEIEPLVKFGFPITDITDFLPNLSKVFPALPTPPAGVSATNQHPYLYVGAPIRDVSASFGLSNGKQWIVQPSLGAGFLSQWKDGLVADVRAGCALGNQGFSFGTAPLMQPNVKEGVSCTSRLHLLY